MEKAESESTFIGYQYTTVFDRFQPCTLKLITRIRDRTRNYTNSVSIVGHAEINGERKLPNNKQYCLLP